MMQFDLSFLEIDPKQCTAEELERARREFAEFAATAALFTRTNEEFLSRLEQELPGNYLQLVGIGTTRNIHLTPLNLVVKLQRKDYWSDPLSEQEFEERKRDAVGISMRRRTANLAELLCATKFPLAVRRIYGFMGGFGSPQSNPSILVAESVATLDRRFPHDGRGIRTDQIGVDENGIMHVCDDRITSQPLPAHLPRLPQVLGCQPSIWLGNIGVTEDGRYVLADAGGADPLNWLLDSNFVPNGYADNNSIYTAFNFSMRCLWRYQREFDKAFAAWKGGKNNEERRQDYTAAKPDSQTSISDFLFTQIIDPIESAAKAWKLSQRE